MTNTRQFWDAIDANRAAARRKQAEARADREMDVEGLDCDDRDNDLGDEMAERESFVCPVCGGRRTTQPDYWSPPEPCWRCVDEDEGA